MKIFITVDQVVELLTPAEMDLAIRKTPLYRALRERRGEGKSRNRGGKDTAGDFFR